MPTNKLFPKYKFVRERKPHCPNCSERLEGNNSMIFPYKCSCGTWHRKMGESHFTVEKQR